MLVTKDAYENLLWSGRSDCLEDVLVVLVHGMTKNKDGSINTRERLKAVGQVGVAIDSLLFLLMGWFGNEQGEARWLLLKILSYLFNNSSTYLSGIGMLLHSPRMFVDVKTAVEEVDFLPRSETLP